MFFGREKQLRQLDSLWKKKVSSFVTCRGRRRIGKSTLIERFAETSRCRFIKLEGRRPDSKGSNASELSTFAEQLAAQTGGDATPPSNWLNAFIRLSEKINGREKTVVLIDEVSWLGYYDDAFAGTLKIAWDNYLKKKDRLIFVVCGSVSSWIRDNIIDNSAFMGRRALDLIVEALPLKECIKFWGRAAERIDLGEVIDVLSIAGGVPRYLEEIDPSESAAANIQRLGFTAHGLLREDFDVMFVDVVTKLPTLSGRVLRELAGGSRTVTEVASALGMAKSGVITGVVEGLGEAGLVGCDGGFNPETGRPSREVKYRIKDNYSRFYLKCIEPVKEMIDASAYDCTSLDLLPGWNTIMGLAFENLVISNYRELLPELHLESSLVTSVGSWRKKSTGGQGGCQVDLLIQTARTVCLVEIKRMKEIPRTIADEVERKVRCIKRRPGVSVKTALVYDGHLMPGVESDGYFDAVVPFGRLLTGR